MDYILYVLLPQFALIVSEQISVVCLFGAASFPIFICGVTFCPKHYCPFVSMSCMNIYAAGLSPFMGPCFTQNLLRCKATVINFSFCPV